MTLSHIFDAIIERNNKTIISTKNSLNRRQYRLGVRRREYIRLGHTLGTIVSMGF
jgi:hypothetical protein